MTVISVRLVIKVSCEFFGASEQSMISAGQPHKIILPRQCAMWAARILTRKSFPLIGSIFARHYSTVLHSVKVISELREADERLRIDTDDLLTAIRAAAVGLARLSITAIDDIDVSEVAMKILGLRLPSKVAMVSVDEVRALAAAILSQVDHLEQSVPLALTSPVQQCHQHQSAIEEVLAAVRVVESARYGPRERGALDDLSAKLSQLCTIEKKTGGGQHGTQET